MRNVNVVVSACMGKFEMNRTKGQYLASIVDAGGIILMAAGGKTELTAKDALNALVESSGLLAQAEEQRGFN